MDDIKLKKAASKRLRHTFRTANTQCVKALPSANIPTSWISDMYIYFEPTIKEEIKTYLVRRLGIKTRND